MEIEIFSLCDFAQDMGGKLVVIGTFDTLWAASFPYAHPMCSIATRIRFDRAESGKHSLKLFIVDQDGRNVLPPFDAMLEVAVPPNNDYSTTNFCINITPLALPKEGRYSIDFVLDGKRERSLPVFARSRRA
ncbi:MAG: hypothetical protein V1913_18050 [Fibrobacterota bacterium]